MGIGKIGGGGGGKGAAIASMAEARAARLSETCSIEHYKTARIEHDHGKRAPAHMPLYLAKNRFWLGRARRRELACPRYGFRRDYTVEEQAHIVPLTQLHGDLLHRAWCGRRVDPVPGPHQSRWGKVRSEATCPDCRALALGFTMGKADV